MEKILRIICKIFIPILVVSIFTLPISIFADEKINIYTLTEQMPILTNISNTSFGYESSANQISLPNLFDKYNYYFQRNFTDDITLWVVFYNSTSNYYVLFVNRSSYNVETYNKNMNLTSSGINTCNSDLSSCVYPPTYNTGTGNWYFYGIYDDINTNSAISDDFNSSFGNYKTLDDFYICQKNNYYQSFNYDIYNMLDKFTYYDSNVPFYIDKVLQEKPTTPEPEPEPEPEPIEENLDKIFVPKYQKGQCVEIKDKDTLRVFENENSINYTDYFINSHYISKDGQVEVNYIKKCSSREFTSIGYYRNDFPEILFMIGSLCLFSIGFIFILFKRFRKR